MQKVVIYNQHYLNTGITGVTANNLDAINKALHIAITGKENVNVTSDIQSLIDNFPTPLPAGVTIITPTLTATLVSTIDTTYGVDVDGNIPSWPIG